MANWLAIELTDVMWQQKAVTRCRWEQLYTLVWEQEVTSCTCSFFLREHKQSLLKHVIAQLNLKPPSKAVGILLASLAACSNTIRLCTFILIVMSFDDALYIRAQTSYIFSFSKLDEVL